MKDAYVDPSCLVALAFGEGDSKGLARPLASFDPLISSNLLEAGLCSAIAREEVAVDPDPLLAGIERVLPDRPLSAELQQTLASGYLRGGDCWHLACALLLREELPELPFLTLDLRQREVAARLGFGGLPSYAAQGTRPRTDFCALDEHRHPIGWRLPLLPLGPRGSLSAWLRAAAASFWWYPRASAASSALRAPPSSARGVAPLLRRGARPARERASPTGPPRSNGVP